MYRTILLIPVFLLGCQPTSQQQAAKTSNNPADAASHPPVPFKLIGGDANGDSAVFEAGGITATIVNSPAAMQTIHITQRGKRLINYMRATDSCAAVIPVPALIITETDTVVGFNLQAPSARKFFFNIKNNKATYTKMADPQQTASDSIKKAPADAGAF
ncbi:hypothetical protein ACTJJ0_16505 [Chitinophaga sp. 22321]|uniref:Lipoprotein n=1 Tax=Chitinophaga hostae TaxID=2831022 RepID=A0ABS5J4F1_9BACT|nr:hypothetical protein [Chitinophaga hostae]MBS0029322.1 hypothetical protein [Chitinophaga hostae]